MHNISRNHAVLLPAPERCRRSRRQRACLVAAPCNDNRARALGPFSESRLRVVAAWVAHVQACDLHGCAHHSPSPWTVGEWMARRPGARQSLEVVSGAQRPRPPLEAAQQLLRVQLSQAPFVRLASLALCRSLAPWLCRRQSTRRPSRTSQRCSRIPVCWVLGAAAS